MTARLFFGTISSAVLVALLILPASAQQNIEVLDKYFYGEVTTNGVPSHRTKTTRIPNIPDRMCFGWVIKIKPRDELAKITEIFTLPAEPEIWAGVEDDPYSQTTTSKDRKIATTIRFAALKKGELENSWCVTKGDKSGPHQIIVLYGSQVLAEFEFELYD